MWFWALRKRMNFVDTGLLISITFDENELAAENLHRRLLEVRGGVTCLPLYMTPLL